MTAANTFVLNNKWERAIAGITEREWMNYFSVIKLIKEVKLKDFQYKVTNKILVTKSFLYRINKIDNDRCDTVINILKQYDIFSLIVKE